MPGRSQIAASISKPTQPTYTAFFHAMLDGSVYRAPSPYEAWFLPAAHLDAALAHADALPSAGCAAGTVLGA